MCSHNRFINLHPPVYGRAELSLHPLDQGFVSFVALQGPQESEQSLALPFHLPGLKFLHLCQKRLHKHFIRGAVLLCVFVVFCFLFLAVLF